MVRAPKVLPAGMATRLIRNHCCDTCSNHKHLDMMNQSVVHHVGDRNVVNKVYLSHIFPETKAALLLQGFKRGRESGCPSQRCHQGHTTHVGRTEAVPRHWLSLANYDPCCRGYAAPWRQTVCHGLLSRVSAT
jgi:hypothetical protein